MTREEAIRKAIDIVAYLEAHFAKSKEAREELVEIIEILEQEPCGDAISRQAVLDLMRGLTRWCVRSEDGKFNNVGLLYDDVMFGIDRLPSVTPKQKTDTEPETGRWIDSHIPESMLCECSECGFTCGAYSFNYCPNCGCSMKGELE